MCILDRRSTNIVEYAKNDVGGSESCSASNLGCPRSGHRRTDHRPENRIKLGSLIPNWCLKILCDVTWPRFSSSKVGNSAEKGENV